MVKQYVFANRPKIIAKVYDITLEAGQLKLREISQNPGILSEWVYNFLISELGIMEVLTQNQKHFREGIRIVNRHPLFASIIHPSLP